MRYPGRVNDNASEDWMHMWDDKLERRGRMRGVRRTMWLVLATGAALAACAVASTRAWADDGTTDAETPQTILPPGLYLLQTRTRSGTCDDAPRTGYVTSTVTTLDGVPGARSMTLKALNSKWWPHWQLTVALDDTISGYAVMMGGKDTRKGVSRFEVKSYKDRFQGVGSREYPSGDKRCTLHYDVLLKPIS